MRSFIVAAACLIALGGTTGSVQAAGCLKGAAVGGLAGHVAGHHGALGAAAGCAVGHHEASKEEQARQAQADHDNNSNRTTDTR
ncbi:MAG TPA: hypothetical protein VHT74_05955 [Acetobacteraceae bacterium]|nr:hypothetical protein [Acetobacteraceae bacterium]